MALSWVKVIGAATDADRDIFVNGNYIDAAGTINTPFRVETGKNTFALLKPDMSVDCSVDAVVELHGDPSDPQLVNIRVVVAAAKPSTPTGGRKP